MKLRNKILRRMRRSETCRDLMDIYYYVRPAELVQLAVVFACLVLFAWGFCAVGDVLEEYRP